MRRSSEFVGAFFGGGPVRAVEGKIVEDGGEGKPGLQIFRDHGYNWVRLGLLHTPTQLPNHLEYTLECALAAKKLGYRFLLDFHYSDTWADPGKQTIPKAWQGMNQEQRVGAMCACARATNRAFDEAGVTPEMVQVGNEISNGMLWPDGRLPGRWDEFADLVRAGVKGVEAMRWFFDKFNGYLIPYDVIGQSFYP